MVSRPRPDQPERALWRLLERVDRLETMVYGRSSSVTDGRTRFIGEDSLIVIGSQLVSGVLRIIGRLVLEGIGILTVHGLIELFGNMVVRAGGMIEVIGGKILISGGASPATLEDGKLSFGTGGAVEADTSVGGVKMTAGDSVVNAGTVASIRKGQSSIIVGPDQITINPADDGDIDLTGGTVHLGRGTIPQESGTGLPVGTLRIDGNGYLRRSDGT